MSVYGGIEITEHGGEVGQVTRLYSYPGLQTGGAAIMPNDTMAFDGVQLGFYCVPGDVSALVGNQRNSDWTALRSGRVRLTNDTVTAEWVVEGHAAPVASADERVAQMVEDMRAVLRLREQLLRKHQALRLLHDGTRVLMGRPANMNLRTPVPRDQGGQGFFEYLPQERFSGSAQVTVQYENLATVERICKLNVSRFLPGEQIGPDSDVPYVTDTLSALQQIGRAFSSTAVDKAQDLLDALAGSLPPLVHNGTTYLDKKQMGLVALMVLNDAMATTVQRYGGTVGQTRDKNIQRFFPKTPRRFYVNAVARKDVPPGALAMLRTTLQNVADTIAQHMWNHCDPRRLPINQIVSEVGGAGSAQHDTLTAVVAKAGSDQPPTSIEADLVRTAVLGDNYGGILAGRIRRAARAYTDTTGDQAEHAGGNVVTSIGFSQVVGGGHGAVYEFRDRELPLTSSDDIPAIAEVLKALFKAA